LFGQALGEQPTQIRVSDNRARFGSEEGLSMKMLKFAAGLAVGYVMGARAGRGRYQQIVEGARNLADQPVVTQAQSKVTSLLTGDEASASELSSAGSAGTASAGHRRSTEPKPPSQRSTTPPAGSSPSVSSTPPASKTTPPATDTA
jgi:hypothetical protein